MNTNQKHGFVKESKTNQYQVSRRTTSLAGKRMNHRVDLLNYRRLLHTNHSFVYTPTRVLSKGRKSELIQA